MMIEIDIYRMQNILTYSIEYIDNYGFIHYNTRNEERMEEQKKSEEDISQTQ